MKAKWTSQGRTVKYDVVGRMNVNEVDAVINKERNVSN